MAQAAFRATYSDWKLIRTRKVVQIVFEVPVEQAGLAYEVLGGMPRPDSEVWCAVARLDPTKENAAQPRPTTPDKSPSGGAHHKSFHEMTPAQQAGILCADPAFINFIKTDINGTVNTEARTVEYVRWYCGVESRSKILPGTREAEKWRRLAERYRAWMREPAVVG